MLSSLAQFALNRRQFLTIGAAGVGSLTLSPFFSERAMAGLLPDYVRGKSVIFIFQQGGPSQFETFDPKPEAPAEIRTVTGTVPTSIPGVHFGETMERLSKHAHKMTVVRSFQTGNAGHNVHPMVSADSLHANIGALYARVVGPTDPNNGTPTSAVLFPQAASSEVAKGQARGDIAATGSLGPAYAPVVPGGAGDFLKNLRLNIPADRLGDRTALLAEMGKLQQQFDADASVRNLDDLQRQAVDVLTTGRVADALDLSKEDPKVLERYDTTPFVTRHNWEKVNRGKRGYYTGHAKTFGKLLLMARRLCEAGCGFVIVHADYEGVWDMHADGNNLNMVDGMQAVGRSFDHGVSAFIEDAEARGTSDKIMLMATGEMGRTPRINKNGGRDHWAKLAPMLIYGGGIPKGNVVGQSTRDGGEPEGSPLGPKNMISTILHALFDIGKLRLEPSQAQIARLGEIPPVPGLF
jgi:uncharacterized protein (DUF1501 family)